MTRLILFLLAITLAGPNSIAQKTGASGSESDYPGNRLALVIGNSKYTIAPLRNPVNDADAVSQALRDSAFQVIDIRDATLAQMRQALRQFGNNVKKNGTSLVFYAGHGVSVRGINYLIPVNADIQREDEVAEQALSVEIILEQMASAVNILILDACRDSPFSRGSRGTVGGLMPETAAKGTIIAFASAPSRCPSDGGLNESNSPFTKNLVKAMQAPNRPIELMFKDIREAVVAETKGDQIPWENSSLMGNFYFRVQK